MYGLKSSIQFKLMLLSNIPPIEDNSRLVRFAKQNPYIICILSMYENRINAMCKYFLPVATVLYIIAMIMSFKGTTFPVMELGGRCNVQGGLLILAGVSLIMSACHIIKKNFVMSFIGRNSIVFYFLSGVFPAFVGTIAQRFFPERIYAMTIIVTILSLVLAWMASFVINKYFPFFIDLRKLKHTKNEK